MKEDSTRLLCLSNGHGEDAIASKILQQLQSHPQAPKLAALPLVGEGGVYRAMGIPLAGQTQTMPSGGFIYMDGRQLWRDLRGGLLQLLWKQWRAIRSWRKSGGVILAIGDIVPLLLAWLSGAEYYFVGTAKSEYYLRDEAGQLPGRPWWDGWSGSVYLPWERWLMTRRRCRGVFPRDYLTTQLLSRQGIKAFDLGNPMMDGLGHEPESNPEFNPESNPESNPEFNPESNPESNPELSTNSLPDSPSTPKLIPELIPKSTPESTPELQTNVDSPRERLDQRALTILFLPGSRPPEAYENWKLLVKAMDSCRQQFPHQPLVFLAAIVPSLDLEILRQPLQSWGWQPCTLPTISGLTPEQHSLSFRYSQTNLILTQRGFRECLFGADFAVAMAGTATEQFVGLGKPAIAIPGKGPQYTYAFAEAQTRLLGASLTLVKQPEQVGTNIYKILHDADRLQIISENGRRRLGKPGAGARIAQFLMQDLSIS